MENLQSQGGQTTAHMPQMTLPEPVHDESLHDYLKERIATVHSNPEVQLPPDAIVAQRLQSVDNSLLLEAYLAEWDRYAAAAKRLNRLLDLINRHYVLRNIDEGKEGIYKIRTLHFVQWRAHVWEKISDSVIDAALHTIERGDEKAATFKDILERFASLRVDDSPESDPRRSVRTKLEAAFVPEIEAHERKLRQLNIEGTSFAAGESYVEG
ncbi:hypothetical protein ACHAP5_007081 [Fusarium lateritium]